jgi:hypothetical protein
LKSKGSADYKQFLCQTQPYRDMAATSEHNLIQTTILAFVIPEELSRSNQKNATILNFL